MKFRYIQKFLTLSVLLIGFLMEYNCRYVGQEKKDQGCEGSQSSLCAAMAIVASGSGSSPVGAGSSSSGFTIGGTITGLTGSGLILQNNGGDDLSVPSEASLFVFSTKVNSGSAYSVTIKTQPTNLTCTVTGGSGMASANVTGVSIACVNSCPGSTASYSWGTFTDCNNGTIKFVGVAGTFGSHAFSAQTLYFMKCTYGQTYNSGSNDCTGTGTSGSNYGATAVQFCTSADNACNGNDDNILLSSGPLYDACNGLSLGGKTWRVPDIYDLMLITTCTDNTMPNFNGSCAVGNRTAPNTPGMFSNTLSLKYWSSRTTQGSSSTAFVLDYNTGGSTDITKTTASTYARCVSSQ